MNSFFLSSIVSDKEVKKMSDNQDSLSDIPFRHNAHQQSPHEVQTDWLALRPNRHHNKMLYKRQRAATVSHNKTRLVAEMTKEASPSQSDVIFVVMNALVNVLVDEVLLLLTAI